MRRKAAPAAAKPSEPVAAPTPIDGPITNHREAAAAMLVALAGLPPTAALDRLTALYATLSPGSARRAVLKARLTLLRDGLPTPVARPVVVELAPVPDPPVPKPAPRVGALSTLALEDAARLLAATEEEDDGDQAGESADPAPPPPAMPPVADLFAELAGTTDPEQAPPADVEPLPDPAPPKPRAKTSRKSAPAEGAAGFVPTPPEAMALDVAALLSGDAEDAADKTPPAALADLSAAFAALDEPDGAASAPAPDLSATFAALSDTPPPVEDAQPLPAAAPKPARRKKAAPPADLSAAFAALSEPAEAGPLPPPDELVQGVAERIGDLTAEDDPLPPLTAPQPRRIVPEMSGDAVAASLAALIGDGAANPPAPVMPAQDVADRLTRIETAFADEAKGPPKRKTPTDLSAVAATFAALDGDEAD